MVLLQKQIAQPWLSPVVWSYILQLSRVYPWSRWSARISHWLSPPPLQAAVHRMTWLGHRRSPPCAPASRRTMAHPAAPWVPRQSDYHVPSLGSDPRILSIWWGHLTKLTYSPVVSPNGESTNFENRKIQNPSNSKYPMVDKVTTLKYKASTQPWHFRTIALATTEQISSSPSRPQIHPAVRRRQRRRRAPWSKTPTRACCSWRAFRARSLRSSKATSVSRNSPGNRWLLGCKVAGVLGGRVKIHGMSF